MNSQFKNSNFGSIVYISIIAIIAIGLITITWYMTLGYKLGTYSEGTILGGIYLGGLREEDVESRVIDRTDRWFADETVVFELTYQGYRYEFDRTKFVFNLELSKTFLKDGKQNQLFAVYQDSGTDRADTIQEIYNLPFLDGVKDNVDYEALVSDILMDASLLKTYSSKAVEDYLLDPESSYEELSSVEFHVPDGVDVDLMIQSIHDIYGSEYIDVNSKELYDMITVFGQNMNDSEMTILSSAMLELSLETNFSIHEVHYNPEIEAAFYTLENYPYYGRNAKVDFTMGNSFSLYNPNESAYRFKVEKVDGDTAVMTLVGLPFVDTIQAEKVQTEIGFITLYTDDDELTGVGRNGMIIVVHRTILNLDEEIIYEKDILFEFYPPVTEIILEPTPE